MTLYKSGITNSQAKVPGGILPVSVKYNVVINTPQDLVF